MPNNSFASRSSTFKPRNHLNKRIILESQSSWVFACCEFEMPNLSSSSSNEIAYSCVETTTVISDGFNPLLPTSCFLINPATVVGVFLEVATSIKDTFEALAEVVASTKTLDLIPEEN